MPAPPDPSDDDPHPLERLTASVPEPRALSRSQFRAARGVFRDVARGVATGSFTEAKDSNCEQALVADEKGIVRGFTWFGGSEHHAAEFRHYFDDAGRLRLLLHIRHDESGGSTEDIVAFDPTGSIVACEHAEHSPGMPAPDLCADEHPEPDLDAAVAEALQPRGSHRPRNSLREYLQSLRPAAEFGQCEHGE